MSGEGDLLLEVGVEGCGVVGLEEPLGVEVVVEEATDVRLEEGGDVVGVGRDACIRANARREKAGRVLAWLRTIRYISGGAPRRLPRLSFILRHTLTCGGGRSGCCWGRIVDSGRGSCSRKRRRIGHVVIVVCSRCRVKIIVTYSLRRRRRSLWRRRKGHVCAQRRQE